MKLVAVALVGLVAGMLLNCPPTRAEKEERADKTRAELCARFQRTSALGLLGAFRHEAETGRGGPNTQVNVALLEIMNDTFCAK